MNNKKDNFVNSIKVKDKSNILYLQRELKANRIQTSDLTDEQLQEMIELYKKQIEDKKEKLKEYRKIIRNGNG